MVKSASTTVLIADACVLLDLRHRGELGLCRRIARVLEFHLKVIQEVVDEVAGEITPADLAALGIEIIPTKASNLVRILAEREKGLVSPSLSTSDHTILLVAEDGRCVVWTNDRHLAQAAVARGVRVMRLFEPLLGLVAHGDLSASALLDLAAILVAENSWYPRTLVADLRARLGLT